MKKGVVRRGTPTSLYITPYLTIPRFLTPHLVLLPPTTSYYPLPCPTTPYHVLLPPTAFYYSPLLDSLPPPHYEVGGGGTTR